MKTIEKIMQIQWKTQYFEFIKNSQNYEKLFHSSRTPSIEIPTFMSSALPRDCITFVVAVSKLVKVQSYEELPERMSLF